MPGLMGARDATYTEDGRRIPHKNSRVRRIVEGPTGELAEELERGRHDKVFWAERFLGIVEHPGQQQFSVVATMRAPNGWSPAFRDIVQASGNRAGKTLNLATTALHQAFYKLGIRPPDPTDLADVARWTRAPYNWYHVSYEGKVANLVYIDLRLVLTGSHPAQQGRPCPLVEELGPIIEWDRKELGEYPWIKIHPTFGGAEIHFRHTNERAKALLGLDMNGISFDEAAFELYLNEVRNEVLHLRRLATGGPIFWISTGTQGHNAFADLWEEGSPDNVRRHPRVLSLRMSTRDNIGYGITREDFDDLVSTMDPYLIPQNIDGEFIEAPDAYFHAPTVEATFENDLPPEAPPVPGHRYAQGVDLGIAADATGALVIDFTTRPWTGVRLNKKSGRQTIPAIVNMVNEGRLLYQANGAFCTTVVDATGMGGKMFMQEFSGIKPLRAFDFAGTKAKKLELLSDLKAVIDRGDLRLPRTGQWGQVRRQLLAYKLDDKKIETDLLMSLALAVRHATRNPSNPMKSPTFDYFGG